MDMQKRCVIFLDQFSRHWFVHIYGTVVCTTLRKTITKTMKKSLVQIVILFLLSALLVSADEYHFVGTGSASFDLLSNLLNFRVKVGSILSTPLRFPGAQDEIYFDAAGTYTINIGGASFACSAMIVGGANISGVQTLAISTAVTISNRLSVTGNAVLNLAQGAVISGAGALQVAGALTVQNGASIQSSGTFTIETSAASVTLQGSASVSTGTITNSGKLVIAAGARATLASASLVMQAGAQLIADGNATISANAYSAVDNTSRAIFNGYITVQGKGNINLGRSAISGSGTIDAGIVTMNGKIQAGNSPGTVVIRGDLVMDTFAEFVVEVYVYIYL